MDLETIRAAMKEFLAFFDAQAARRYTAAAKR